MIEETGPPEPSTNINIKRKLDDDKTGDNNNNIAVMEEEEQQTAPVLAELIEATTHQLRKRICLDKLRALNSIRMQCMSDLSEQFYLENSFNYLNLNKFLSGSITATGFRLNEQTSQVNWFPHNITLLNSNHLMLFPMRRSCGIT